MKGIINIIEWKKGKKKSHGRHRNTFLAAAFFGAAFLALGAACLQMKLITMNRGNGLASVT